MDDRRSVPRQLLAAVLVAGLVVACLRLGWWQLERFRSGTGSWQNLGYTLQWPTFAVFVVVAWWRLRALERRRREQQAGANAIDAGAAGDGSAHPARTPAPAAADGPELTAAPAPRATRPAAGAPAGTPDKAPDKAPDEAPDGIPDEPDDELAAYNRYLAELNAAAARRRGG